MKKFNYTMNHKADEAYMAKMCHDGWAAKNLVEGIWTFEPCRPDQYIFRVCYLRGKSNAEVEELKHNLADKGIDFVYRYSFWAIFRSEHDFVIYTPGEELDVIEKIRRPMLVGSALSWLVFLTVLLLAVKVSTWSVILCGFIAIYAVICTCLGTSYTQLAQRLRRREL